MNDLLLHSEFLLQISGSQAWLHIEIAGGVFKKLVPGSSPRDSDLIALRCRLGTGLLLWS